MMGGICRLQLQIISVIFVVPPPKATENSSFNFGPSNAVVLCWCQFFLEAVILDSHVKMSNFTTEGNIFIIWYKRENGFVIANFLAHDN